MAFMHLLMFMNQLRSGLFDISCGQDGGAVCTAVNRPTVALWHLVELEPYSSGDTRRGPFYRSQRGGSGGLKVFKADRTHTSGG